MSEIKFKLTGTNAIIALVVVGGFFLYSFFLSNESFRGEGKEKIHDDIYYAFVRKTMSDTSLDMSGKAETLTDKEIIKFISLRKKGSKTDAIVRAEIKPNRRFPKNFPLVYYYQMEYSTLTGWRIIGPVTSFSYHTKFF